MAFGHFIRNLRTSPWYAATSIGTIALTIALGATVFAVVDGVLFKPLPYRSPDRLFDLQGSAGLGQGGTASVSPLDVKYLSEADPRISITSFRSVPSMTALDRPHLAIVSAGIDRRFFDVLGEYPLIGGFTDDHYAAASVDGAPKPAIVTHTFWRQWLGGDPTAVGRTINLVDNTLVIVGVLPREFVFPHPRARSRPDVLIPLIMPPAAANDRWARSLSAIARLRDGVTFDEAKAKLDAALATRIREYVPQRTLPGPYVAVAARPLEFVLGRTERPLFSMAFAGAALLILLGAINVTGLFAARAHDRARELSIRAALGARRRHLIGVLLSEAATIAFAGGVLGVLLAYPLLNATLQMLPESVSLLKAPVIDWRVLVFAMVAALVPVVVFAVAPTLGAMKTALIQRMAEGSRSTPMVRNRGRHVLLAAEGAIGIALVVTGSLLLVSFLALRSQDAGFDSKTLAVVELRMAATVTPDERQGRETRVFDQMRRVPGVSAVATVGIPLLENSYMGSEFKFPAGAERILAADVPVSSAFFDVGGLRLLDGRVLTPAEIDTARPVVVVSEGTARAYWPNGRAVGQLLDSPNMGSVTVVGVVEDARFGAQSDDKTFGQIYMPARLSRRPPYTVYLLKTVGDPALVARDVALALQQERPGVLVGRAESFDTALSNSVRLPRFRTILFTLAAGAGLLLLAVGTGGLVATGVARRVREIGIRAALGAQGQQLVTMVILDNIRPLMVGLMFGLLASWWTTRLVSAFLYQIDAHEPVVWMAAVGAVLLVAILAAWLPARRASGVDPMMALRTE
jgi:putative ABC transport system permease protein